MQAAYEQALDYAENRKVFGQPISEYQLIRAKLGRIAVLTQAGRQFSYAVATLMAKGAGQMEASMVKAYVCKAAEWVTRRGDADSWGHGLRRGVSSQPTVSSMPACLSIFERRRRNPLPQGDRPPTRRRTKLI